MPIGVGGEFADRLGRKSFRCWLGKARLGLPRCGMGRSHVWRCRFALGERRPRGGRTVLTWGQSSGENQLTGSAIVTERHREKSRRCYAARRHTSQRICIVLVILTKLGNSTSIWRCSLSKKILSLLRASRVDVKSFNYGKDFFFLFSFFLIEPWRNSYRQIVLVNLASFRIPCIRDY